MHSPPPEKNVKKLLDNAQRARSSKDVTAFADAIRQLLLAEPQRWLPLAALNKIIPEPDPSKSGGAEVALLLRRTCEILDGMSDLPDEVLERLKQVSVAFKEIYDRLDALRKVLDSLAFNSNSVATTLYRLSAFAESQNALVGRLAGEYGNVDGFFDPARADSSFITNEYLDVKVSPQAAYEALAEDIDLICRYVLWRANGSGFGELDATLSP